MIHIEGFSEMLETIQRERGLSKEVLKSAIGAALISACKKRFATIENLEASIDEAGEAKILARRKVVRKVSDKEIEISLKEAKKINPKAKSGKEVLVDITPSDFGRLAAQTAKQVIIQRIREAEKETAYEEFSKRQGEIVTGIVQRKEYGGYLINLGRTETLLPPSEQIPGEALRPRDRIKLYIVETKKTPKGPLIIISRSHPDLVKKLFELEIPEIKDGIIEIKNLAREPGRRSKMAVSSRDKNVGAVGTCIGPMGNRIQNVLRELGGERIDVIEWSEDPKVFITHALSPAKATKVEIKKEEHAALVTVPESQLSLAIGKEGQNVRLAAKLTGWKIDIQSEAEGGEKIKLEEAMREEALKVKAKKEEEHKKKDG